MSLTKDELLALVRKGARAMSWQEKLRLTVLLSLPAMVAQISSVAMQIIDAAMLGHLGTKESATVGLVSTTIWLFGGLCSAFAAGFSVQVAHLVGAEKLSGARNITGVDVYSEEGASSDAVVSNLRDALDSIYNDADNAYSVFSMDSLLSTMNTVKTMLQTMLGGIASISLVVGGIGIMNMMLVSVSERTKEIGLRKALGAEPMRIQMQFLIEAVVLSVFGGIIGVIIGEIVAYVGAVMLKTTYSASVSAIMLGLGFSLAVGIVFGWAPARRASRLNPIDALRAE